MVDSVRELLVCRDGGYEYYFRVVEFQHRGLPHCHIALRVRNAPELQHMNKSIWDVLNGDLHGGPNSPHIQTDFPRHVPHRTTDGTILRHADGTPMLVHLPNVADADAESLANDAYIMKVCKHMIHNCRRKYSRSGNAYQPCRKNKKTGEDLPFCRRNYPQPYVSEPFITDTGYPRYKRTRLDPDKDRVLIARLQEMIDNSEFGPDVATVDDIVRRVVPHNRELLSSSVRQEFHPAYPISYCSK
eukprot:SAG31_NODE_9000_length_1349_cov_16.356800_2_plen_244_part_00